MSQNNLWRPKRERHWLPWALLTLGVLLAAFGLVMLLQTREVLQYCAIAPQLDENGESIVSLVTSGRTIAKSMEDSLPVCAVSGSVTSASISTTANSEEAGITAIGEGWLEIYPRFLVQGRRVSETELANGERVAMLDEGLAFKLFGEELPEDAKVAIGAKNYRVVGTVRHAGSLMGVGEVKHLDCYIPLVAAAKDGIQPDVVMLSGLAANQSGAAQVFEESAQSDWLPGGSLIDTGKEAMRRTIVLRVILLIVGLYAVAWLFRQMTRLCAWWFSGFGDALKEKYMPALIPKLLGILLRALLGYGAIIALAWALMFFSVQPLYVFTEWVPDNIVEWSSLMKVFTNLTAAAARPVRVGSRELRVVEFWGGVVRWGTIFALLGMAMRRRKREE